MFGRSRTENQSATSSFSDPLLMLSAIHCSTSGDDSNEFKTGKSLFQLVQCSTVPNDKNHKYVNQQMIPFPNNQKLITCQQPLSRDVTGLLRRLQDFFQIKIENIYVFKITMKKHENAFKNWLCPNFLLLPKKSELPKFGGTAATLAPTCIPPPPLLGPFDHESQRGSCLRYLEISSSCLHSSSEKERNPIFGLHGDFPVGFAP